MIGYIYKLFNENGVYFGSTRRKNLKERYREHKYQSKIQNNSSRILFNNKVNLELVEIVECNNKKELLQREQFYIDNNKCLNVRDSIVNIESSYKKNKEYMKEYNTIKKEHYAIKRKEKVICPICLKKYGRGSYLRHFKIHY